MKNYFLIFFISILFLFDAVLFAQSGKKSHYVILPEGKSVPQQLIQAIESVQWESYRYIDKRRQIPIEGGDFVLELFSANELLEKYGRQPDPRNQLFVSANENYLIQEAKGILRIIKR